MEAELDPDELEWMACQPLPEEENYLHDGDHAGDADDANVGLTNDNPTEQILPNHDGQHETQISSSTSQQGDDGAPQSPGKRRRYSPQMQSGSEAVQSGVLLPDLSTTTARRHDRVENGPSCFSRGGGLEPKINCRPYRMVNMIPGDYVPITGPCGSRVYARLSRSDSEGVRSYEKTLGTASTKGLLEQPINVLLEKVETERLHKILGEQSEQLPEKISGHLENTDEQLWVDKYAPRSFTDLLSDEQTNREVVRWLKQWDFSVFGHETTSVTTKEVLDALKRNRSSMGGKGIQKGSTLGKRKFATDGSSKTRSISSLFKEGTVNEAHEKVLLLCGPPGLGKTTLAHVAARHSGYRIVEINASDDRVASTLQNKILDAVQMKSVAGSSQPNCLVIDEIDGAVGGQEGRSAIKQLVDIVTACKMESSSIADTQGEEGGVTKRQPKRKKTAIPGLARPIICICNDLYSPSLRPLRQIARIHIFSRPKVNRVVNRLKHICREEGFKADPQALTTVAEHAESDIRACLNTLQFLKRKGEPLTAIDAKSKMVGSKDMTKSAFDIWYEVFRKVAPSSQTLRYIRKDEASGLAQSQLQFLRASSLITNFGNNDLAIDGIFENLLRAGYQDSSLSKTVECLETICDSDTLNVQVHSKQRYFLIEYQPATMLKIRNLVAVPRRPDIQWPRAFQRHVMDLAGRREIMIQWLNRMSPGVARTLCMGSLTLDVVSPLLRILSPPLRAVSLQMYSNTEKETMNQLVDSMVSYGLTYKAEKATHAGKDAEGNTLSQGGFLLNPPVDALVIYEGYISQYRQMPWTICHIIGHEVGLEKIRRESLPAVKQSPSKHDPIGSSRSRSGNVVHSKTAPLKLKRLLQTKVAKVEITAEKAEEGQQCVGPTVFKEMETTAEKLHEVQQSVVPTVSRKVDEDSSPISVKKVQIVTRKSTSYFDRWKSDRGKIESPKALRASLDQRQSRPVLYKFHEGFTNAIRRPVLVREFF